MVETLYATIEPMILHLVRLNRTLPLYTGRNGNKNLMAHKAIDDHVEGLQPAYGALGTNPENRDEFCEASIHVTFYKKAAQFANIQYYRNESKTNKKNAKTDEIEKSKLRSIASNRSKEKMAIAEYISLISATSEVNGRKYVRKEIWDALSQTTVELKEKKSNKNSKKDDNEGTVGIDRLAAAVYNAVTGDDEDGRNSRLNNDRNSNEDVELPSGFYGEANAGDIDSQSNETNGTPTENANTADRNEIEIRTGKVGKKTVRVRRTAVNMLSFKDVIKEGRRKLESRQLPVRRYRRFARQQRKRRIDDEIYLEQKKYSDNGTENEETINEMAKLKRR